MPNKAFLETYPLYRKFVMPVRPRADTIANRDWPTVDMYCRGCGADHTFEVTSTQSREHLKGLLPGNLLLFTYRCVACKQSFRYFLVNFDPEGKYVIKVGQEPPWDISLEPNLEGALGNRAEYYKRGKICESQGYGIGAFAYYRRIIEEIIDPLLNDVPALMSGEERGEYLEALEKVKKTPVAKDKIALVKDLLPLTLRPDGMNPLSILHEALSEGIHNNSDERCMELAEAIREGLEFLTYQITVAREHRARFTKGMRKLLDRKKQ